MNGLNGKPPDKSGLDEAQDKETILSEIEVKQEPIVKVEPVDAVEMVTAPAPECAAGWSYLCRCNRWRWPKG